MNIVLIKNYKEGEKPRYSMNPLLVHEVMYPTKEQFEILLKEKIIVKQNGFRFNIDISLEMFEKLVEAFKYDRSVSLKIANVLKENNEYAESELVTVEQEKEEMEKYKNKDLIDAAEKGIILIPQWKGFVEEWMKRNEEQTPYFDAMTLIKLIVRWQDSYEDNAERYYSAIQRDLSYKGVYLLNFQEKMTKEKIIPNALKLVTEYNKVFIRREHGLCHLIPRRAFSNDELYQIRNVLTLKYYEEDSYGGLTETTKKAYKQCKMHKHCITFAIALLSDLTERIKNSCKHLELIVNLEEKPDLNIPMKIKYSLKPFQIIATANWFIGKDITEINKELLKLYKTPKEIEELTAIKNMHGEIVSLLKEVKQIPHEEAVKRMKDIFNKYNYSLGKRGTLAIFTRGGKSYIGYFIAYLLNKPTLFVVRTEELLKQFYREIVTMMGIDSKYIGIYYGKRKSLTNFTIGIYNTFANILDADRFEGLQERKTNIEQYVLQYIFNWKRKGENFQHILPDLKFQLDMPNQIKGRGRKKQEKYELIMKEKNVIEYLALFQEQDLKEFLEDLKIKKQNNVAEQFIKVQISKQIEEITEELELIEEVRSKFELLVVDECHHIPAETFKTIAIEMDAMNRLGLSATPKRQDKNEAILFQTIGKLLYAGTHKDLLMARLNCPVIYEKRRLPLSQKEASILIRSKGEKEPHVESFEIEHDGYWNELALVEQCQAAGNRGEAMSHRIRAQMIAYTSVSKDEEIVKIVNQHRGQTTIIFTMYQEHARRIVKKLQKEGHKVYEMLSGTSSSIRQIVFPAWKSGLLHIIVTARVLDEGITVPDATVMIIASGTSNVGQMIQRIGRTLGFQRGKISYVYELVIEGTLDEDREHKRDVEKFYNQYEGYETEINKALMDRILYTFIDALDILVMQKLSVFSKEQFIEKEAKRRMKSIFEPITNMRDNLKRIEMEFVLGIRKLDIRYKPKEIQQQQDTTRIVTANFDALK